jgi:hypothetical protein
MIEASGACASGSPAARARKYHTINSAARYGPCGRARGACHPSPISQGDRGAVRSVAAAGAREMGVLNMGTIGLDGTKIHTNASRHMWTAPSSQEPFAVFGSDRLRPYVRPVGALAHERWPRWFPRREFQTQGRPLTASAGYGVSRVVDRSITPSACCLASSGIGSSRLQLSCSPCLADL